MSVAWILGSLSIAGGIGGAFLVAFADGMADAPQTGDKTPLVVLGVGVGLGALIIGSHYVKGLHW